MRIYMNTRRRLQNRGSQRQSDAKTKRIHQEPSEDPKDRFGPFQPMGDVTIPTSDANYGLEREGWPGDLSGSCQGVVQLALN